MAAPRRSRAGLGAAAGAVALAAALAVSSAVGTGEAAPLVAMPGGLAVAVLAGALLFRIGVLLPLPLLLLIGQYGLFLVVEGGDRRAPFVAAALVLVGELAYWGVEPRAVGRSAGLALRRLAVLVTAGVGAAALAAFLLGASALALGGGVLLAAVGVVAAVGALALLALLARPRPA